MMVSNFDRIEPTGGSFVNAATVAQTFSARVLARPGNVSIKDRIDERAPQEHQLGEELFPEDASFVTAGKNVSEDYVGTIDQSNGLAVSLNRFDEPTLAESYAKSVTQPGFGDNQTETDDRGLTIYKSAADSVSLTELYFDTDLEGNVSDSITPVESLAQNRSAHYAEAMVADAAAIGVSGYGEGGYGEGGYGGEFSVTG